MSAALIAGCAGTGRSALPSEPSPLLAGPAPDFKRATLDGSVLETSALRGRVMVVDFFAEHCAPCVKSLPAIEGLHRAMPEVTVLGVSEDDERSGARRMVALHGLSFPVVHDDGHVLAGRFRVMELPATFVVDARGIVRWRGTARDQDEMRAVVESAR